MSKRMIPILTIVLALLLGLAGCQKATQTNAPKSNQSLANPASVYCRDWASPKRLAVSRVR